MIELNIKAVREEGNLMRERVVFQVTFPCDIGSYVVLKARVINNNVSNTVINAFWFPDKRVNPGDTIVLYTKSGFNKEKVNSNGTISHFFYWNLNIPNWREDGIAVLLMKASEWTHQILIGTADEE
jgi:hypothetical protein